MKRRETWVGASKLAGLYLIVFNGFEILSKIVAQLIAAIASGQLPTAMLNQDLFVMILANAAPFLVMAAIGCGLYFAAAAAEQKHLTGAEGWMAAAADRKAFGRTTLGLLVTLSGLYGAGVYSMGVYAQVSSGPIPAEMMGMLVKMVAPTYVAFVLEVALGAFLLVTGLKQPAVKPVSDEAVEAVVEGTDGVMAAEADDEAEAREIPEDEVHEAAVVPADEKSDAVDSLIKSVLLDKKVSDAPEADETKASDTEKDHIV